MTCYVSRQQKIINGLRYFHYFFAAQDEERAVCVCLNPFDVIDVELARHLFFGALVILGDFPEVRGDVNICGLSAECYCWVIFFLKAPFDPQNGASKAKNEPFSIFFPPQIS
jgi:hypothetical protein